MIWTAGDSTGADSVVDPDRTATGEGAVAAFRTEPARDQAVTAGDRPLWRRVPVEVVVLSFGLVVAFGLLVTQARRLWFFGDDWDFLAYRGTLPGEALGVLVPHNEHWSTVPILIYRAIFSVVGLRHFLPYMVPVLLAHLVICAVTYWLLRRFGSSGPVSVTVALLLAFYGAGAEDTLWAFQIGFVGSVMFGLLAVAAVDALASPWLAMVAGWVLLLLGLMSSGVGLSMVGVVAVFVACQRGVRSALVHVSLPVACYAVWYPVFGRQGTKPVPTSLDTLPLVPQFVWTGLTGVFEKGSGIPASGAVILLAVLTVALIRNVSDIRLRCVAWAGIVGALMHFTIAGISRVANGVDQGLASRYLYLGAVLLAPALAMTLDAAWSHLRSPRWAPRWLVGALATFVLINGVAETVAFRLERADYIADMRGRLPAGVALVDQGALVINDKLDQIYNPDVTVGLLQNPGLKAALPQVRPDNSSLLSASSNLQVAVTPRPIPVPYATEVTFLVGFAPDSVRGSGCQSYAVSGTQDHPASLVVDTGASGAQITYTGPVTSIQTVLHKGDLQGPLTAWSVPAGQPLNIGSSMGGGTLEVRLSGTGRSSVCVG